MKIFGAGEWSSREKGKKHRRWRKLHVGVDEEGRIVASALTGNEADDATTAVDIIKDTDAPIERFTADGAYDRRAVHYAVGEKGVPEVKLVIPPGRRAVPSESSADPESNPPMWTQRDEALQLIAAVGRLGWQRESGYRKQGRVENTLVCDYWTCQAFADYREVAHIGSLLGEKGFIPITARPTVFHEGILDDVEIVVLREESVTQGLASALRESGSDLRQFRRSTHGRFQIFRRIGSYQ